MLGQAILLSFSYSYSYLSFLSHPIILSYSYPILLLLLIFPLLRAAGRGSVILPV